MLAARYYAPRDIRLEEVPKPQISPGKVLVKIKAAGICGSDMHNYRLGMFMSRVPIITGHEFVGVVQEVGSGVKELKEGDHVLADSRVYCGKCNACQAGKYNNCPDLGFLGEVCEGGFAEYALLPEAQFFKIPQELQMEKGVILEPLAVVAYILQGLEKEQVSTLAVLGAGSIGLLTTMVASTILKADVTIIEPTKLRRQLAKEIGAKKALDPDKDDLEKWGAKFDVVVEAAGVSPSLSTALELVKTKGKIILAGLFEKDFQGDINLAIEKELTLRGINGFQNENIYEALNWITAGIIDPSKIITQKLTLENINQGFSLMDNANQSAGKIIIIP